MSNVQFFSADTLGMVLHPVGNVFKALEIRTLPLGTWDIPLEMDALSDLITPKAMTFWLKAGKLPLYVVVRDGDAWVLVLGEGALKVCGAKTGFAATTLKGRIQEMLPAIRGVFQWQGDQWEEVKYDRSFTIGG